MPYDAALPARACFRPSFLSLFASPFVSPHASSPFGVFFLSRDFSLPSGEVSIRVGGGAKISSPAVVSLINYAYLLSHE